MENVLLFAVTDEADVAQCVDCVEGHLLDLVSHFYDLMMRRQDKEWPN